MSKDKNINEGYVPQKQEKGYKPITPDPKPSDQPQPNSGYVPTQSGGDNPTNNPSPPGDE